MDSYLWSVETGGFCWLCGTFLFGTVEGGPRSGPHTSPGERCTAQPCPRPGIGWFLVPKANGIHSVEVCLLQESERCYFWGQWSKRVLSSRSTTEVQSKPMGCFVFNWGDDFERTWVFFFFLIRTKGTFEFCSWYLEGSMGFKNCLQWALNNCQPLLRQGVGVSLLISGGDGRYGETISCDLVCTFIGSRG